MRGILTLLLAGLFVLSGWMQATAAAQGAQGEVKADSGFQPKPNGFSFENWGAGQNPQGDLTAADAQCLFGDAVCERTTGGNCEPTPAARMWIEQMNKQMGGGHCEGLAALSAAFYSGLRQPQAYGGQTAYELKVDNAPVLRMISTIFVTQFLEPVQSATQKTQQMSTRQIVDTLMEGMKSRQVPYTLGIYGKDGGHAITPFAVEDRGNGRYLIHVYDNNYPGADNVVEVDTNADTWRYSGAALNPGEKAEPWEGKGGSMDLTTLSLRFEPLVCPFCAQQSTNRMCGGPASSQGPAQQPSQKPPQPSQKPPAPSAAPQGPTSVVTNANCDQLSVTDKSGRSASFSQGKMNSKIPGVNVSRIRGARGCVAQLPPGGQYNVSVTGKPGQQAQPFDTTVFRPGQVVSLSGCAVTAGHVEKMDIGDSSFGYTPGSKARPTFAMATDNVDGKNGYYEVEDVNLGAGHIFSLNENDEGQITFDSDDPDLETLDIKTSLEDEKGTHDQNFDNVEFDDHGQAILAPNEEGELEYGMDTDSDGQINAKDKDDDNDGTPDAVDKDDDNDGTPDAVDEDSQEEEAPEAVDEDSQEEEAPEAVDEDSHQEEAPEAVDDDSQQEEAPEAVDEDSQEEEAPEAVDEDDGSDVPPDAVDEDSYQEEAPGEGEDSGDVEMLPYAQVFGWQGDCSLHSAGLFAESPSRFSQGYDLLNG